MPASVDLPTATVVVQPGADASLAIRVRNTGQVVDEFVFDVLGDAAPWAAVVPDRLPLFPGADGEVRVVFRPPRGSSPVAGQLPFGVRVRSREDAGFSYVVEGRVTVGAVRSLTAQVRPRTAAASRMSGRSTHRVRVENAGNLPAVVQVTALDPDDLVSFDVRPATSQIAPGGAAEVLVAAIARQRPLQGSPLTLPFQITVSPDQGPPIVLDAALVRRPLVSAGLLPLVAVVVPILAVAAILGRSLLGGAGPSPSAPGPTSSATQIAQESSLSPNDSSTPATSDGSPTPVATDEPTPTATATMSVPEAAANFARLSVEDPDNPDARVREIRFAADGPGVVSATIGRIIGGSRLRVCLEPEGQGEHCSSIGEETVSEPTGPGTTNWILTIAGDEPGMAPAFDLGVDFASSAPRLELKDFRYAGASAATNGIDLRIRARNPGPLTFDGTWPVSGSYTLTLTDLTNRSMPPLDASGGPAANVSLPANDLIPGDLYQLQFVGTGVFDETHFDASVSWP